MSLESKFYSSSFTLSREAIYLFNEKDNGPINNVITGISKECFGVRLFDDPTRFEADFFYISGYPELKGDLITIEIEDKDYWNLLFMFCKLLEEEYEMVDAIDAFNTFQSKLRGFLELSGFFTATNIDLKQFEGKGATMMVNSKRGFKMIELIDKVELLRAFFNQQDVESENSEQSSFVYLMVNTQTSLIKIGTSKNPSFRERTLQSREPEVHLIAKWKCAKVVEKELHEKYKMKRVRGEWFRLKLKDINEIQMKMSVYS